jgi:MerR family transcriptional regulator, copper efflux regulator
MAMITSGADHEPTREAAMKIQTSSAGQVPIACTLGAGEVSTRVDEWHALLQGVTARRVLDDGLRLELRPDVDVTEVARLAAAEQGCCRFFDFALVLDGRGIALEVHAPPDGQPVLTALFGTAGEQRG